MNGKKFWIPLLLGIGWLVVSALLLGELSFFANTEWIRAAGFFLAGVGVAPLGLWLAHLRTASLASQTENEITRRVTDSFTKAVELLGHAEIAVRQGGIYALGRIAAENRKEHLKIMSIIAAYIRHRSRAYVNDEYENKIKFLPDKEKSLPWDEFVKNHISKRPSPIDLEAAVAIICDRDTTFDVLPADGASFLNLSGAFLFRINFSGASLEQVDFTESILHNCIFRNARLNHAIMHRADFTYSDFHEADMSEIKARFATFSLTTMKGAKICGADLCRANFEGASLSHVDFSNADLTMAKLIRTQVNGVKFDNVDLRAVDLSRVRALNAEQLKGAVGNLATSLPKGIEHPAEWHLRKI